MPDHPHPRTAEPVAVYAEKEDWDKAPVVDSKHQETITFKISKYGSQLIENHYGRPIVQISPPAESTTTNEGYTPNEATTGVQPRWIVGDTGGTNHLAHVQIKYNLKGDGLARNTSTHNCYIPTGHWRPVFGATNIKCLSGRVTLYGEYTDPNPPSEDE